MVRRGLRIGAPQNVGLGFIFSAIWGAMAIVTIIASVVALEAWPTRAPGFGFRRSGSHHTVVPTT